MSSRPSFFLLGSILSFTLGLICMVIMIGVAKPLLTLFSDPESDETLILDIALQAQVIIAFTLPARIYYGNSNGISLGMRYILLSYGTYAIAALITWSVILTMTANLTCEEQAIAAEEAGGEDFDPESWVCPESAEFLSTTASIVTAGEWIAAMSRR